MDLPLPIHVLSDLHLGHPASYVTDPAMLTPLLEGAATVVFNGDTFEQFGLRSSARGRDRAARLAQLCVDKGVRPVLVAGNHDPVASSCSYLDLMNGRIFVTHGDALHPHLAPWSKEAPILEAERNRLLAGEPEPDTLDGQMTLTRRCAMVATFYDVPDRRGLAARAAMVGKFVREPLRIFRAIDYWTKVPGYANEMRRRFRPHSRIMLIGHSHRPGVWQSREFTLINTGSFMPLSDPVLVRLTVSELFAHTVRRRNGRYHFAEAMHRQFL